ncbi:MAG: M23 family metallopeptidase [Termitinemataceae bacterium]
MVSSASYEVKTYLPWAARRFRWIMIGLSIVMLTGTMTNLFAEEFIHMVKKGDTLYSIARQYQVPYQDIAKLNNIKDPSAIKVGQKLTIPGTAKVIVQSEAEKTESRPADGFSSGGRDNFITYKVKKGDTLFGIARAYSVTVETIRSLNNLKESSILKEGMLLKIPATGTPQKPTDVVMSDSVAPVITENVRSVKPGTTNTKVPWPVEAKEVAYLTGKLYGVVIVTEQSNPVRSLTDGVVVSAGPYRGFGRVVIVQAANGYVYVYGGCETLLVREGEQVRNGAVLGRIGVDSLSKQPQLYFLVYKDNKAIDPALAPRG